MKRKWVSVVFLILLILCLIPAFLFAKSSKDWISEGNQAYQSGQYDQAINAYEEASVSEPESPHIYFNKGTAFYMKGEYSQARELFEKAALKSKDPVFEARSYYNLGNCAFRESERQRDSDLQKSLKELETSVRHYQKALKLDPTLKEAAHNIEVTRLMIKQILDEIKKQQEQMKEQQKKQQEAVAKLKELIQQQEQLAEETKTLEEQKKQTGVSNEMLDHSGDLHNQQETLKTETEKLTEQMDSSQNNAPSPLTKAKEHLQRSISEQTEAKQELHNQKWAKAHLSQKTAAEEMKKALETMENNQGNNKPQEQENQQEQGEDQQNQKSTPSKPETQQPDQQQQQVLQRDEDAHNILNEERENQEKRQLQNSGEGRSVDKDW